VIDKTRHDAAGAPATWAPDDGPLSPGAAKEAARAAAAAGRRTDDRFELIALLGRGGMGEVWRARDLDLGRTVAMKIMRPDVARTLAGRFLYEARATAGLEHASIVAVHEVGVLSDGRPYYTMREVRGTTLRDHIRDVHQASTERSFQPSVTGWSFRRLVEAFQQACEAVSYAHARGIIHRDLKPDNVMLGDYGEVIVVDWGLVKVIGDSSEEQVLEPEDLLGPAGGPSGSLSSGQTLEGQAAGTVGYMPPEQARGELNRLGPAADVYAMGGVLACILTGRSPGREGPDMDLLGMPRVPPALRQLSLQAMCPDIEGRPADAGVLGEAVRGWLDRTASMAEREARQQALDQAFTELPPPTRERCRELLLSLVDAGGASSPRPATELDPEGLAVLVSIGVVRIDGGRAQVADRAVEDWPRLRAWVVADRQGQRLRHEMTVASAGWIERGRRSGDLWRGELVEQAAKWMEQRSPILGTREQEFLAASARGGRRRKVMRQLVVSGIAVGLVLATAFSTSQWRSAESARSAEAEALMVAEARALRAQAATRTLEGRDHAAMVLEQAYADLVGQASPEAADLASRVGGLVRIPMPGPAAPSWSADGTRLALLGEDGSLTVLDASGKRLWSQAGATSVAWAPAGHALAVLGTGGALSIAQDERRIDLKRWPGHSLAWPDDLVLRGPEGAVRLDAQGRSSRLGPVPLPRKAVLAADGHHASWMDDALHVRSLDGGPDIDLPLRRGQAVAGFLPDLWRLWTGDQVGGITIFDRSGRIVGTSPGGGPGVSAALASPDGTHLAVGGYDNLVRVLDLGDGHPVTTFDGHDRPIYSLAFHPSGQVVASGGYDDEVLVWEVSSGRVLGRLAGLPRSVSGLAFSPDGRTLAVTTESDLSLWSPAALPTAALPSCPSVRARLLPGGRLLAMDGATGSCVVDLFTGGLVPEPDMVSIEGDANGHLVGLASGAIVQVDIDDLASPRVLARVPDARGVLVGPEGGLVTYDEEGVLSSVGAEGTSWKLELPDWPGWLRHGSGERWASYLDQRGGLVVVDLLQHRLDVRVPPEQVSPIITTWVVQDDELVVGDGAGRLRRWRLDPREAPELLVEDAHHSPTGSMASDGDRLAVGDGDGHVRIFQGGELAQEISLTGSSTATSLAFSPDGKRLLIGLDYAGMQIVDLATGGRLRTVDRHARGLLHSLFWLDPDRVLGVGGDDAWAWEVPATAPEALTLTNLRVCRDSLQVVPVAEPGDEPWAPAAACDHAEGGPPGPGG